MGAFPPFGIASCCRLAGQSAVVETHEYLSGTHAGVSINRRKYNPPKCVPQGVMDPEHVNRTPWTCQWARHVGFSAKDWKNGVRDERQAHPVGWNATDDAAARLPPSSQVVASRSSLATSGLRRSRCIAALEPDDCSNAFSSL